MSYEFTTERLLIRPWRNEDRPAFARMAQDAEMMRYVSGSPMRTEQIDRFFVRQRDNLERSGMCMGALALQQSGEVVGVAGAQPLDREPQHDIGWWIWKDYWRRGYASEAAAGIVAHAWATLGLERISAVIDPDNAASIGVAEKIGMRLQCRTTADQTASWRPTIEVLVYGLERPALAA